MENGQFQRLLEEIQKLRAHGDRTAQELRAHTDQTAAALRAEIRESAEETRRHMDIRFEAQEATNRLLAEGIAAVDEKLDRKVDGLRAGMNAEFAETRAMIKLSYRDLDRRLTTLEERA